MRSIFTTDNYRRLGFALLFPAVGISMLILAGVVSASPIGSTSSGALAQATTAPNPVTTITVPVSVPTGGGVAPNPVQTGQPANGSTTDQAPTPGTGNPGRATDSAPSGTAAATSNNGFPWLPVLIVAALLLLAGLAFMMTRNRRTALTTVASATTAPVTGVPASTATTTATTNATAPTQPDIAAAAPFAVASTAPVAPVAPVVAAEAAPRTLTCPNCSTVNSWTENFCHECGQDLRPARAAAIAAAAPPPEIVTDDMPYLETIDRADEQLEYVLSRPRIVIGTAPGSDIVIDRSFKGYETVAPRHAELRREGDAFLLVDLDSENGTFVNEARTGENLLTEGDQIRFGSVRFIYRVP